MIYYYYHSRINQSIGNDHLGGCVSASVYQQDTTQEFQTCEGESYARTMSPLQLNNWYYFVVSVSDVSRDDAQFTLDISQYSKSFLSDSINQLNESSLSLVYPSLFANLD